jgi:hypothetical protein
VKNANSAIRQGKDFLSILWNAFPELLDFNERVEGLYVRGAGAVPR